MQANQGIPLSKLLEGIVSSDIVSSDIVSGDNGSADKASKVYVSGITLDSRQVTTGDLFLACAGHQVHGVYFASKAIDLGAAAIVVEENTGVITEIEALRNSAQVPVIAVPNLSKVAGVIAERFHNHPSKALTAIGITGTNGKTSCSQFLAQALSEDKPCGIIGTIGNGLYGKLENASHTTPDAVSLHGLFKRFLQQGAASVVMEVSSHGLVQGRVAGVSFDVAVFTNLSRDHLDYHGDMQAYGDAKKLLFQMPGLRHAVINADDVYGRQLIKELPKSLHILSYGINADADVNAANLVFSPQGMAFDVHTPWGEGKVNSALLGRFNISNVLAALATLLVLDIPLEKAVQRIERLATVPGRMERVEYRGRGPLLVVDYAHTPDAVEKALASLREHFAHQHAVRLDEAQETTNRIFCVFGCGGDRDKGKRAAMGTIAEANAGHVIVTNDNPRGEDPEAILRDILQGVGKSGRVQVILDRREAIRRALTQATADDAVIILGKGHEQYQIIGNEKRPYPGDYAVAAEIAAEIYARTDS